MIDQKEIVSHLIDVEDIMRNVQMYYLRAAEILIHDYCRETGMNNYPVDLQLSIDLLGKIDDDLEYLISSLNEDQKILAGKLE